MRENSSYILLGGRRGGGEGVISVDGRAKTYNIRQGRLRISFATESVFGRMVISRTWRILEILFLKLTIISSSRWLALYAAKIKIWRNVLKGRRENVREFGHSPSKLKSVVGNLRIWSGNEAQKGRRVWSKHIRPLPNQI